MKELEKFLLELGGDFTFVARQKRIICGDEDFYIGHSTLKYQTPNQTEDKYYKEKFISLLSV